VLLGDSVTAELRAGLQTLVQRPAQGVSSEFKFLFDVGLKPASGGKLKLDETRLKEAIERDPRGVVDLFAARVQLPNSPTRQIAPGISVSESVTGAVTSKGIMEVINDELDRYVRSTTGVLTRQSTSGPSAVLAKPNTPARPGGAGGHAGQFSSPISADTAQLAGVNVRSSPP